DGAPRPAFRALSDPLGDFVTALGAAVHRPGRSAVLRGHGARLTGAADSAESGGAVPAVRSATGAVATTAPVVRLQRPWVISGPGRCPGPPGRAAWCPRRSAPAPSPRRPSRT